MYVYAVGINTCSAYTFASYSRATDTANGNGSALYDGFIRQAGELRFDAQHVRLSHFLLGFKGGLGEFWRDVRVRCWDQHMKRIHLCFVLPGDRYSKWQRHLGWLRKICKIKDIFESNSSADFNIRHDPPPRLLS